MLGRLRLLDLLFKRSSISVEDGFELKKAWGQRDHENMLIIIKNVLATVFSTACLSHFQLKTGNL